MTLGDFEDRLRDRPWRRKAARRTPKERLRLVLILLVGLYVANVSANVLYKLATQWQVDLLHQRLESLARIDPRDREIARLRHLMAKADYNSLIEAAPRAIAKRAAIKAYLQHRPHLTLGVAVDGTEFTPGRITGLLQALNQRLRPHRLSVGLAEPVTEIKVPPESTRDDILQGITKAFRGEPEYVVAFVANRCVYSAAKPQARAPASNRIYSFGWRGLSVVDGAVIGQELNTRLQAEFAKFLQGKTRERRWRPADYALRPEAILANHQIIGRVRRGFARAPASGEGVRTVQVSIGLDGVSPDAARAAIRRVNEIYRPLGVHFAVAHLNDHRLTDTWKWPVEMKRMLERGSADIYVLLTDGAWASPERGLVRGLANGTVGAVLIQTGTRAETTRRLAHEFGHLFGLPHTLLRGHVMYPNEGEIGLRWSPGSKRLLARNRASMKWYSSIISPARYDIASKLAPVMRRVRAGEQVPKVQEAFASGNVWASCGAR